MVVSRATGERVPAYLQVCECGCQIWNCFIVVGDDHPHLQCDECGDTYCSKGSACNSFGKSLSE